MITKNEVKKTQHDPIQSLKNSMSKGETEIFYKKNPILLG